jgi:SAM-dependent methyltransferase
MRPTAIEQDVFLEEYTSHEALVKYTRATAGYGISYLLDHDYKRVYLEVIRQLPPEALRRGIRILEFGCGGGMNLLHLVSVLNVEGIRVEKAIGTDFSPTLVEAARREAKGYLREDAQQKVEFHVAKNESVLGDLSSASGIAKAELKRSFDFVLGVNTIRYCHEAGREIDCARDMFELLAPQGVCVVIDMNNRFPCFKSDVKARLNGRVEEECYVPTLEEYTTPFAQVGFEVLQSKHFCWVPHSSGRVMCRLLSAMSPVLNVVVPTRAMRSLVVARRPGDCVEERRKMEGLLA